MVMRRAGSASPDAIMADRTRSRDPLDHVPPTCAAE
jgi:hypothetical protein